MSIEVKLPNLGEGIDNGDVLELLVKEGEIVAKDQGIIELETGKATLQVPSSAAGKISKIHVKPGQSIPPGTLLLTLEGAVGGTGGDKGQGAEDRRQAPGVKNQQAVDREATSKKQQTKEVVEKPKASVTARAKGS